MIEGIGGLKPLTYSQTLNEYDPWVVSKQCDEYGSYVGHFW